jgi:hypothetical protein
VIKGTQSAYLPTGRHGAWRELPGFKIAECGIDKEQVNESLSRMKPGDIEIGLESLVDKYGMQKVMDTVARMSKG